MKAFVLAASLAALSTAAMAQAPQQPQLTPHEQALETLLNAAHQQEETLATQAYQLNQMMKQLQDRITELEAKVKSQAPVTAPSAPTSPAPVAPVAAPPPMPSGSTRTEWPAPNPPATPTDATSPAIVAAPVVTKPAQ